MTPSASSIGTTLYKFGLFFSTAKQHAQDTSKRMSPAQKVLRDLCYIGKYSLRAYDEHKIYTNNRIDCSCMWLYVVLCGKLHYKILKMKDIIYFLYTSTMIKIIFI